MKPIATDTNDFPQLRNEGCIYVDKTMFIHRLLTTVGTKLYFISRPKVKKILMTIIIAAVTAAMAGGKASPMRVVLTFDKLIRSGKTQADILHHGVSLADHGGWCSFVDRESFRRHLDAIAELERQGKIVVTNYDGVVGELQ